MSVIAGDPVEMAVEPGYRGFSAFAQAVGLGLEGFQRRIAREALDARELVVLLPRGNGKSRLVGTLAVHHLVTTPRPAVIVAAASRDQARVVYEYARDVAMHPGLRERITVRHLELRASGGSLRVVASDAPKLHGATPSLVVVDEMQAFRDDSVYLALRTAVHKRPGAQMWVISTASRTADDPLGKLRSRALGQPEVKRRGGLVVARGPALTMLEWSAPEERGIGARAAALANPASWLRAEALAEQRAAVPEPAYRQFHLNQWVGKIGSWLPAGCWQACGGLPRFEAGGPIYAAVDLGGGQRSTSALVWVQRHGDEYHVGSAITDSEYPVEYILGELDGLGKRFRIVELTADEWRAPGLLEEARQRGIPVTVFPQSDSRLSPASQRLYELITTRKVVHAGDELLDAHVLAAVARQSRRGWRLERPDRRTPIDGAISLCMAIASASKPAPAPARLLGWL